MSKRHAATTRSGPLIWIVGLLVLYALGSFVYAWSTIDSACGAYNDGKEWRIVPPGWDCPEPNF